MIRPRGKLILKHSPWQQRNNFVSVSRLVWTQAQDGRRLAVRMCERRVSDPKRLSEKDPAPEVVMIHLRGPRSAIAWSIGVWSYPQLLPTFVGRPGTRKAQGWGASSGPFRLLQE